MSDPAALVVIAGPDPAAALRIAEADVRAVLSGLDPERPVATPLGTVPVAQVLATAVVEPLIHGWDLAMATGQPLDLDPGLAAAVLPGVEQLGPRLAATGMYAPALPVPDDASRPIGSAPPSAGARPPRSGRTARPAAVDLSR